jgi:hypothetical protein
MPDTYRSALEEKLQRATALQAKAQSVCQQANPELVAAFAASISERFVVSLA